MRGSRDREGNGALGGGGQGMRTLGFFRGLVACGE